MNLSALFIKRPVTTTLIMLGILVFGVMAYRQLPVSDLPTVDFPTIQVSAEPAGREPGDDGVGGRAAAREAVRDDCRPDLDQLDELAGQHEHHAAVRPEPQHRRRRAGRAGDDRARRRASCRRRCRRRRRTRRSNPGDQPVLFLVLQLGDAAAARRSTSTRRSTIAQRISMVSGVAQVQRVRRARSTPCASTSIRASSSAHGIGIDEVAERDPERERQPADRHDVRRASRRSPCRPTASCCGAAAYGPMIVAYRNGNPVRLDEVAHVYDGVENDKTGGLVSGRARRSTWRSRSSRAPTSSRSSTRSRSCCRRSASSCRPSVSLDVRTDRSVAIRESVHDVKFTLLLTVGLVVLVIFLFLRNVSATIIPSLALPVSIVGDLRGDVPARLQPRQPVADGAHAVASASSWTMRS